MEAEIFCLDRDLPAAGILRELLSTRVDPSITLTVHNVEEGDSSRRAPLARRYTQLLQATIPPSSGISLSVTAMDWFQNRIYMRIYWPMSIAGGWEEVAGTSVFYEGYRVWRSIHCLPTPQQGMELFFPALALRNRMVMVPAGQDALLTQIGTMPPDVSDALARDVFEVDFRDRGAVENAVTALSQRLVAEIRRDVTGYMAVHPGVTLNVSALSAELGVGLTLFNRSMREEAASVYELLSFELAERRFIQGRWTKTRLLVRNNSASHIPQVKVKISGPAVVIPPEITVEIPPHSQVLHDVSIQAEDSGEFPLSVTVLLPHHEALAQSFASWQPPPTYIWLESAPA